jgi:hypothetical protein
VRAWAKGVFELYPHQDAEDECIADLSNAITQNGHAAAHWVMASEITEAVQTCATQIAAAPGGKGNRFVPLARKFFLDRQWRSPASFERLAAAPVTSRPEKPKANAWDVAPSWETTEPAHNHATH